MTKKKELTAREVAAMGGRARWEGKDQKARSRAMKKVRRGGKKLSTPTSLHVA